MGNLFMGTDAINLKDAMRQVNRNIFYLQQKLMIENVEGNLSWQLKDFYERKIESQKVILEWLERAL